MKTTQLFLNIKKVKLKWDLKNLKRIYKQEYRKAKIAKPTITHSLPLNRSRVIPIVANNLSKYYYLLG